MIVEKCNQDSECLASKPIIVVIKSVDVQPLGRRKGELREGGRERRERGRERERENMCMCVILMKRKSVQAFV